MSWLNTASTSEDATPAAGWLIGDIFEARAASSTGGFTLEPSTNLQIRVNGTLGSTTTTNNPPTVANAILDQTATAGTALNFAFPTNTFADTDAGDTLTYTATQSDDSALPAWLSFDAATRTFSGTPQAADVETVSVKVTASDGNGGSVSDTFDIVVSAAANNAAMGAPTITGTAQVGETLTAVTTGITDADGLTSVTYTYQWIRANGTEADIASANSSTYILIAADLGKTIKVKVSFTDDASNDETLTSAATATVVAAPTAPMVSTVVVTSMPASDDTYGTGEKIQFTVTFDQAVTVTGTPEFEFCLGSTATVSCSVGMPPPALRSAALLSGSGTTALVFSYTVLVGDVDDNGIYVGNQNDTIKLDGGDTIQGTVGGLTAVLTHDAVGSPTGHKVNGAAANTAPTAAHNTVTTAEDRAYTFTAVDFGFMDADAGAALASVKIVTVPGAGTLALDGTAVMAADVVTEAQIDADMLTFTPARDAHGAPYTTFTFKVNDGTDDSASAYTMTIDVTDAPAPVCAAPSYGDRREIWTGTVTAEEFSFMGSVSGYGFDSTTGISSLLPSAEFSIGSNNYTIVALSVVNAGDLLFNLASTTPLTATERAALRLHVCDEDLDFSDAFIAPNNPRYGWTATLDWSPPVVTRTVYLSLPANNVATDEPTISGTAQAGQELTADASPILDTDGLTGVDFTYQWLRVDADGTSNPADITDATAATYTLTAADAGKKVKVKVSFTDELSGEEERTSAAYPSSGTVIASTNTTAPALLSVTVTSTPHKTTDTYGAREHIEFSMTFDAPVTVTGDPTFAFDLGGASTASWYAGSGTTTLRFSHAVTGGSSGDRDTNGISWAANAIELNGGTIAGTYNAVAAVLTHAAQSNLAAHKVDGRTTPVTPATVTDVVVTSTPMLMASGSSTADTYGFGETIVITVTVSEAVEVVGDPGFRFNIGNPGSTGNVVEATYDRTRSTATAMAFVYTVQAADMDTNGFWIGPHSQTFLLDANDRIRTASQQINIDRSHTEEGTQDGHKVDGSLGAPTVPPDPTAPTLVSATATTLTIEWTHPGDGGSPLTRNFIEYRVEGTTDWTNWYRGETPTTVTRAVITNLEAETAYEVRVHSTNAIGNSQWVQSATAFSTLADGAATNNAPTAANNTVTTGVGAAYTFEADDFGFDDADTGDTLASVKIVTRPAVGTLALDGTAVTLAQVVTKAQIDGDMLTFTPVAGASGTGYASFTFKVNDGTDDSVSAYTMTIDVAASPTVSIAAPTGATDGFLYEAEAAEDIKPHQWLLTRVGLTDAELTVNVSVAETGGGDFAADGADTVTFAVNKSTTSYTPITDDTVDEEHGTVTVTVTDGTGYDVDPDAARAALAVRDDDGELVTVTLDPATLTVKEGGEAQFHAEAETEADTFDDVADMARLFGTVTQASVEASTEASTGTGAATADTDYTALAAETVELPFADFEPGSGGVLRLRVALPAIATTEDEVTDPDETFKVKLAAPADQDARIAVSTTAATVTISEGPPDGAIRLCSGTAASTCTDVNEALATRNTQGRVEVINDGEWGTVCDDYWSNGDGQVACTQMGYAGAERVFWSSHFGGAAKGTRTWLDNLQCAGDEDDLFACPRHGGPAVGDHNCNGGGRHVEDAGVRCLAANTAAMGAPTITGTAQVGETLTAATTGITDANGLTSPTYTYQWIRANGTEADIASANSSTYILVAADLGKTIKVKVSFEDDASNAETLTSAATATVVAAPTAPMVTDVDVTSMPASDDTYGTGEMIRYTVTFDQAVTVVGAPEFEFCLGSSGAGSCEVGMPPPTRRRAPLSSGSGTTMLVFSYTVVEGDMDDNGIWAGDQDRTIKLEGGTIQGTVGGLDAVLTHTVVGTEADHKVNGAAANTAPTAANNTVTTGVGAAYTFEADDFGFADADAGAALASVKIVTVPAAGALALDGTAVLANAVVTKAQIDGDMLTFTPVAGASGTGYASFTFKVNDGTDDSTSAYTMTIDVAAGPTVSIAAPAGATDGFLYEFEAATEDLQYRWVLTRVGLTDAALTVDVSVAETGGGDFAADGMATVTFDAGESAAAYTPITADDLDEEHGTVTVTVDFGTGYAVDPDAASAEVDVRDDDGDLVTVKLDPAAPTVREGRKAQLYAAAETEEGTFDEAAHLARLFGPTVTQAQAIASTEASTGRQRGDGGHGLHSAGGDDGDAAVHGLRRRRRRAAVARGAAGDRDDGRHDGRPGRDVQGEAGGAGGPGRAHRGVDDGGDGDDQRRPAGRGDQTVLRDCGKHLHGRQRGARDQEHPGPGGGDQRRRVGHGVRRLLEQRRRAGGLHADGLCGGGACVLELALRGRRERHPDVAGQPAVRRRRGRSVRLPTARRSRGGGPQLQRRRSARGGRRGALPGGGDGGTRREGGPVDADDRAGPHGALLGVADEGSRGGSARLPEAEHRGDGGAGGHRGAAAVPQGPMELRAGRGRDGERGHGVGHVHGDAHDGGAQEPRGEVQRDLHGAGREGEGGGVDVGDRPGAGLGDGVGAGRVGALRCAAGRVVRAVGRRLRGARGRPPAGADGRLDGGPFAAAGTGRAGDGRGAAGVRAVGGGAARRPGRVGGGAVRDAGAGGAR